MGKGRLEAFSDGVIAIIITIMVLELKVPHGDDAVDLEALRSLQGVFGSYVLSFVYVGIYWNNHHHMLHASERVTGGILWANLHLLFWLSLVPFATAWMGENDFRAAAGGAATAPSCSCAASRSTCSRACWRASTARIRRSPRRSDATARAGRRSSSTARRSRSPSSTAGSSLGLYVLVALHVAHPRPADRAELTTNPEPETRIRRPEPRIPRPPEPRSPTTRAPIPTPEPRIPDPEPHRLTSL